ncbi:MAG: hypothetical protein M3R00_00210, partial [Pseudomonadota bacterium]|nr:hypothetical protein [Pseudomonadota bacterium]
LGARQLLDRAYKTYQSAPKQFNQMVVQAYRMCYLIIYNRIVNMIMKAQESVVRGEKVVLKAEDLALVRALLNPQVADATFKDIADQLGKFIYHHHDLFENPFELAVLYLLQAEHTDEIRPLLTSSLYKLAGAKYALGEQRLVQELIEDPIVRPVMLVGLAKANRLCLSMIDDQTIMTEKFVQARFQRDANPMSLMWNIVRLYAATHDLSDEQSVEGIVNLYEQFVKSQSPTKVQRQDSTELRRSLSGLLAATAEATTPEAVAEINNASL